MDFPNLDSVSVFASHEQTLGLESRVLAHRGMERKTESLVHSSAL